MDGQLYRRQRQKLGLTQRQVAAWLGVSRPYIADLERGRWPIPNHQHEELAYLFVGLEENEHDEEIRNKIGYARRGPYGRG